MAAAGEGKRARTTSCRLRTSPAHSQTEGAGFGTRLVRGYKGHVGGARIHVFEDLNFEPCMKHWCSEVFL